jgi:hypothetical protein
MKLEDLNEVIHGALIEVAHGQIVNASGYKGAQLDAHLRSSFDELIALEAAARKVAAEKFGAGT